MTPNYLDYAARGANTWWRYLAASVTAVALAILLGALAIFVLQVTHLLPGDITAQIQHPDRPSAFFLFTGTVFGLLAAGFVLALRWFHGKRFSDVLGDWSLRAVLTGFGIWLIALVVTALIDFAIAPSGFSVTATSQTPVLAASAVAGLAVQTFAEEFIFRGYITQGLLLAIRRPVPAAVASGLLFGALHIPNGAPQAVSATAFGIVLALLAIRMGGIAFTWGLHMANNLFAAVVLVSSGDAFRGTPGLFSQDTPHLMWWDTLLGAAALVVVALVMTRRPPDRTDSVSD